MVDALAQRSQVKIYSKPAIRAFSSSQGADLESFLEETERATSLHPIADVDELRLKTDGTTKAEGYRYTSHSFRQICRLLAPGLSTLIPDVSGMMRKDIPENEISGHNSLQIFNAVLDLRFPRLSAFRLIRNEEEKLIEGVVGTKHRSLENLTLLRQAGDAIRSGTRREINFYAGVIIGRRMTIWYRDLEPVCNLTIDDLPWPVFPGYYFCNGEATGTSVRATMALFTKQGTVTASIKKFGGRVTHIGRDFNRRLEKMFGALLEKDVPESQIQAGFFNLMNETLGYADLNSKQRRVRSKKIVKALSDMGIQQRLAADILDDALSRGYRGAAARPMRQVDKMYASRRMFDLFCSTIRTARQLPLNRREKVEQAAYELLTTGLKT